VISAEFSRDHFKLELTCRARSPEGNGSIR